MMGITSAGSRNSRKPAVSVLGKTSVAMIDQASEFRFRRLEQLTESENLFPYLLVFWKFLEVLDTDGVDLFSPGFLHRFDFWMRGSPATLGHGFLSLNTGHPAGKQQRRIGMGRILKNCRGIDRSNAFSQHIVERRSLLDPAWVMVRITTQTCGRLACD